MKLIPVLVSLGVVSLGWCWIASVKRSNEIEPIRLEAVSHTPYDPSAIGRNISFHKSRVERDPEGAIGWSLLSEAWLAKSRESDLDAAAWKAEEAARKSLSLRVRGNGRAFQALVASLLEQHRFQDAKHALEHAGNRTRVYADVLLELGELDKAEAVLKKIDTSKDPGAMATVARLASERGDHQKAISLLKGARQALSANRSVGEATFAWFDVKIATEYFKTHQLDKAAESYRSAISLYPRSYKATLGMAYVEASKRHWETASEYAKKTLEVANSLEAVALLGDARKGLGDLEGAKSYYEDCRDMYRKECAKFTADGRGGPFHVRPIDRQFATFCVKHSLFVNEALTAAHRDLLNRPDQTAKQNLAALNNAAGRTF